MAEEEKTKWIEEKLAKLNAEQNSLIELINKMMNDETEAYFVTDHIQNFESLTKIQREMVDLLTEANDILKKEINSGGYSEETQLEETPVAMSQNQIQPQHVEPKRPAGMRRSKGRTMRELNDFDVLEAYAMKQNEKTNAEIRDVLGLKSEWVAGEAARKGEVKAKANRRSRGRPPLEDKKV